MKSQASIKRLSLFIVFLCCVVSCGKNVTRQGPIIIGDGSTVPPEQVVTPASTDGGDSGQVVSSHEYQGEFCEGDSCGGSSSLSSQGTMTASGYIVIPSVFDSWDAFLFINGSSYYVGSQTSPYVRAVIMTLPAGVYAIRGTGTIGTETGHRPNPQSSYPVVHIFQTF